MFDRNDREDWIAQHFFTGGVMPSHGLIRQYADLFTVEKEWRWSGTHYQRTAKGLARPISTPAATAFSRSCSRSMARTPGLWMRRWRWFFLATAGLFGHDEGPRMGRQPLPPAARELDAG